MVDCVWYGLGEGVVWLRKGGYRWDEVSFVGYHDTLGRNIEEDVMLVEVWVAAFEVIAEVY